MTQKPFTIERTLRAAPARVWGMWTTKEGLESWWGPEGFESTVDVLEVRIGGRFVIVMRAVGADQIAFMRQAGAPLESTESGTYLDVTPTSRLAFVERFSYTPDVDPYDVNVLVTFEPVPPGTRVVINSTGMHDARWQQLASQGWREQMDKLERLLAAG